MFSGLPEWYLNDGEDRSKSTIELHVGNVRDGHSTTSNVRGPEQPPLSFGEQPAPQIKRRFKLPPFGRVGAIVAGRKSSSEISVDNARLEHSQTSISGHALHGKRVHMRHTTQHRRKKNVTQGTPWRQGSGVAVTVYNTRSTPLCVSHKRGADRARHP